jgi:hypothetical protein
MIDEDSRPDDIADEAWQQATARFLPSTTPTVSAHDPEFREISLSYCAAALNRTYDDSSTEPEEGSESPPGYGSLIDDSIIADVELSYLDHIGSTAVNLLVADPTHRVVKQ